MNLLAALALVSLTTVGCAPPDASGGTEGDSSEDSLSLFAGNVDHAAIVEVTTMQLAGLPTDLQLDPYNQEDPFAARSERYMESYTQRLSDFDDYDALFDWDADQMLTWTARIAGGNYLVVDTTQPCDYDHPHSYLEIERAQLTGTESTTCGGRMPNEDAFDVTLNFLVRGPAATVQDLQALHDGVDHATKQSTKTFPYLAEMN